MTTNVKLGPLSRMYPGRVLDFTTLRGPHDDRDPYSGFTVCDYTGDRPEHYRQCRQQLAAELGVTQIVQPRQTHSSRVVWLEDGSPVDGVDGIITRQRGIAIGVNTADCVPVLLYAWQGVEMVAAVHAGWRGTAAGIVPRAVEMMQQAGAEAIMAYTGVSICQDCFEVGPEVAEIFYNIYPPKTAAEVVKYNQATGKAHVNLKAVIDMQIKSLGGIAIHDQHCSRHDATGQYYSARRMGINSGRTFTGIILKGVCRNAQL